MDKENVWHVGKTEDIFSRLNTSQEGLASKEALARLEKYGFNELPESKPDSLFKIFFRQFKSPLIYLLLGAAVLVLIMKEWIDGSIILFVLFFNAVVGTVQAGKAQNTLLALKRFTKTNATVIRDGKEMILPDKQIVPGDIIILQEGEKVPADARIIESSNLRLAEAVLTGESEPVSKNNEALDSDNLSTADQRNMVFKGTNVVGGNGKAVVVETGVKTVIGKISQKITAIDTEIPLQANVRSLTHLIVVTVLVISTAVFFLGMFEGRGLEEMFKLSVAILVSAIPEGLPIVMTLLVATGVWRMSKQNVLVKRLQAVEALGEAKVIAVDKTGTITRNELVVQKIYTDEKLFGVTGIGYGIEGNLQLEGESVEAENYPGLSWLGKAGVICSNARLSFAEDSKKWKVGGDPTEAAMMVFAEKAGFSKDNVWKQFKKLDEVPFNSELKYHAVEVEDFESGEKKAFLAGASEILLNLSGSIFINGKQVGLNENKRKELTDTFESMSAEGLRVIAFAFKKTDSSKLATENLKDLVFVGFLGMKDAIRPEVPEALRSARDAGIKVVMITGDHKITAQAIASDAGIFKKGDTILTDEDIDSLSDEELSSALERTTVFARITPEHKLRIVEGYRLRGEIVAMTGDGVNDALSLVAADLGVAMGEGTEVAKEAGDLILLDENFGSIVSAVEEGRSIFKGIKKVILYLFSSSLGEILVIVGAMLLGWPLPVLAAQLIWINFVTDGFLDVALALEPKEKGILKEKFKKPSRFIMDWWMAVRMVLMASAMAVGTLFLFGHYFENDLPKAVTLAFVTMVVYQWFKAWNCRFDRKSIFTVNPFGNKYLVSALVIVVTLQIFALHTPFMQSILSVQPISLYEWGTVLLISLSTVFVDEMAKLVRNIFEKRKTSRSLEVSPKHV